MPMILIIILSSFLYFLLSGLAYYILLKINKEHLKELEEKKLMGGFYYDVEKNIIFGLSFFWPVLLLISPIVLLIGIMQDVAEKKALNNQ